MHEKEVGIRHQGQNSNTGTAVWDEGILSSIYTNRPNGCPGTVRSFRTYSGNYCLCMKLALLYVTGNVSITIQILLEFFYV